MRFVSYGDLKQLPESANALFKKAAKRSLFFSRPWFTNLLENGLDDGQTPFIACVLDGDTVLAILPLSQLEGKHCHSLNHLYTSLYTLLIAEEHQPESLACLASGLRQCGIQSLQLSPVAKDDVNLQRLARAMQAAGFSNERYFRFRNWVHRVGTASFADYMAERPSRVRNTVSRKQRKLQREHGYQTRLYSDKDLQKGLADYNAVHTASWKANELYDPFVAGLAGRLSESGWLRLAVLYIDNQPAAAQFWFVAHGKASIFKLSYDEAWKRYSPGSILLAQMLEHVIDTDQVEEIDFLTGNDAYKQDWMSERRDRYRLCFINAKPSIMPQTHLAATSLRLLKWLKGKVYNPLFRI